MPYAIKEDGSIRAVTEEMELYDGEVLYEDVPQWAYNRMEQVRVFAEKALIEKAWRVLEVAFIADQLIGMEDGDPSALPGSEEEWRAYRTAVRAWKEGSPNFPSEAYRPVRPS